MEENKDNKIIESTTENTIVTEVVEIDKKNTVEPSVETNSPHEIVSTSNMPTQSPIGNEVDKDKVNTSATLNPETGKWEGYVPQKGKTPPWNPFDPARRKMRVTLKERKFMMMLSTTGSMQEAYRGTYKVKDYGNPKLEAARVSALANQVLRRIRNKAPELVSAMTFEDITPDFVNKEMLKLYNSDDSSIHEKTRLLELMGKTKAMFTDKQITETKVREVVETVYKESDEDFPSKDARIGRVDIEKQNLA